jgi:hypothetical protein
MKVRRFYFTYFSLPLEYTKAFPYLYHAYGTAERTASKISYDKNLQYSTNKSEWQYPIAMRIIVFCRPTGPQKIEELRAQIMELVFLLFVFLFCERQIKLLGHYPLNRRLVIKFGTFKIAFLLSVL